MSILFQLFVFGLLTFCLESDTPAPVSVPVDATEESEPGVEGRLLFLFLLDLMLLQSSNLINVMLLYPLQKLYWAKNTRNSKSIMMSKSGTAWI